MGFEQRCDTIWIIIQKGYSDSYGGTCSKVRVDTGGRSENYCKVMTWIRMVTVGGVRSGQIQDRSRAGKPADVRCDREKHREWLQALGWASSLVDSKVGNSAGVAF